MGCFGTIFLAQLLSETERTRKILTAVAVFNVSPYKSTVLFLISSFNPPLLPRRVSRFSLEIDSVTFLLTYLSYSDIWRCVYWSGK